jgi:FkbM family methyltransferase
VLDAGGCWGTTALYFASLVGPEGRVYSFEFDPESLEVFRANLALNPELGRRIELIEWALWDRAGETVAFTQAGRMTTVHAVRGDAGAAPAGDAASVVATTTIDQFVERTGLERVDYIKMDVEGAELNVLRGAAHTIERFAPKLAIAAYHKDDDLVRIPDAIAAFDAEYRFYLQTFSPVEEETVLFAASPRATSRNSLA